MRRATTAPLIAAPVSKTRRKKDMVALQDLGEALLALEPARLAALGLPERLADAILAGRSITRHEARRRQMQYIGRLMREVDPEPIREALAALEHVPRAERERFAAAEAWRERMLADAEGLGAFLECHPDVDAAVLAKLVESARAERAGGRPPHKYRALFRLIARETGAQPGPPVEPPPQEPSR